MRIRLSVFRRGLNFSCMDTSKDFVPPPRVSYNVPPFSWNLSQPRALQQVLKFNLPVLQSVQYEQGLISCWRALSSNSFVNSMFPTKEKSDQAVFSFLDLILLMPASFDRLTLNYCNKSPHSKYTNWITRYELRSECPLGAEGIISRWNLLPHMRSKEGKILTQPWYILHEEYKPHFRNR